MSLRNQITTADYLPWKDFQLLLMKLQRDGKHKDAATIALGTASLLRFSDFSSISWKQAIKDDVVIVRERKTGKVRRIKINPDLRLVIEQSYSALGISNENEPIVGSSIQYLNRRLKHLKDKYSLSIENFSSHTFRKTGARRILEKNNFSGEVLIKLMELFNHSSMAITKRYLGIRQEEIEDLYGELNL
jgi:integrase